jgi:hypothetical protein
VDGHGGRDVCVRCRPGCGRAVEAARNIGYAHGLVDDGGAGPSYSIKDSKPEVGLLEEILEDVAGCEQVARSRRDAEVRRPGPARPPRSAGANSIQGPCSPPLTSPTAPMALDPHHVAEEVKAEDTIPSLVMNALLSSGVCRRTRRVRARECVRRPGAAHCGHERAGPVGARHPLPADLC